MSANSRSKRNHRRTVRSLTVDKIRNHGLNDTSLWKFRFHLAEVAFGLVLVILTMKNPAQFGNALGFIFGAFLLSHGGIGIREDYEISNGKK